jgi:hypothetical protein
MLILYKVEVASPDLAEELHDINLQVGSTNNKFVMKLIIVDGRIWIKTI